MFGPGRYFMKRRILLPFDLFMLIMVLNTAPSAENDVSILLSQHHKPVIGEPFTLICPLESSLPATYGWTKYNGLDRKAALNMSRDMFFSENGRRWSVDWYQTHHNGFYVCHMTNVSRSQSYSHDTLFFLYADSCKQTKPTISITGSSTIRRNSNLTIHCEAKFGTDLNLLPYWYVVRNGSKQLCSPPSFSVQRPWYNHSNCAWTTSLHIINFVSKEETLYCGSDYVWTQHTIQMKDDPLKFSVALLLLLLLMLIVLVKAYLCVSEKEARTLVEPPLCGFTYDVFVCAHDELRGWIEHVILPLEKKDPPYKLCWHMRDFMAGLPIDQQMVDAVYKSRKVAIIFSKHFMESKFCQLELEYAMYRQLQTRTRCLVPITFSDGLVPIQLRRRLTYLLHKDDDQLVSKLIESLGPSIHQK